MTGSYIERLDARSVAEDSLAPSLRFGRRPEVRGYSNQGFAGGDNDGYNANWSPIARHPDLEFEVNHHAVLARSYEQHRNNSFAYGPTNVLAAAVGELMPTSLVEDPETKKRLEGSWHEWCIRAGADNDATWDELCLQWVGAALMGGDLGIGLEHRPDLGGATPLRIKLHDAYLINSPMDPFADETVRLGVAYRRGVLSAVYVAKEDAMTLSRSGFNRFEIDRNGRPNFRLFRRPDATRRPGQSRSTPVVAACLNKLKDLSDFDRSHVRGAAKRSRHVNTLKSPDPDQVEKFFRKIEALRSSGMTDAATALRESARPTLVTTPDAATMNIPNYMSVETTSPDVTDSGYKDFVMTNLQSTAPCWGLPYEVAYQIWENASYSRAQILTLQKGTTAKLWRQKMSPIATTIWRLHVQYMLASDRKIKFAPGLMDVRWHGPAQEYMDMETEVSAEADGRASGVMSPQEAARRTGRDAFQIERERMEFVAWRKKQLVAFDLTEDDFNNAFGEVKEKPSAAAPRKESP